MNENLQKQQSVFWIEVDKIRPNTEQPRTYFDESALADLSSSIRQYGVLQPLVVIRKEIEVPNGTVVEYELIAGERRLRASKLAGLSQVPVLIREDEGEKVRLELAIIENLQREDLNPVEKAKAFKRLIETFKLKHHEVGHKVGKSREYVTNIVRILNLPEEMQVGLSSGLINEGHTRPLLMLSDRPQEQAVLYNDIIYKKVTVREAERISRSIAKERSTKYKNNDPETRNIEDELSNRLGTRVEIEKVGERGRIHIDFFSREELQALLDKIAAAEAEVLVKEELRSVLNEEPVTPFESAQVDDTDELTKNFSL